MGTPSVLVCGDEVFAQAAAAALSATGNTPLATFSSAFDCRTELRRYVEAGADTLLIGRGDLGVSSVNFAGTIAFDYPGLDVVLVGEFDVSQVPRTLRVSLRPSLAALFPESVSFVESARSRGAAGALDESSRGKVIVVAGARGGVGKTTFTSVAALLSARAGISTALLDLDLQFGDIAFTFDRMPERTLSEIVDQVATSKDDVVHLGEKIEKNLHLFVPSGRPEQAELVAPHIGAMIGALRGGFQLVFIDTGAFWTLLHAEVLDEADLCFMVLGPRAAAVRANSQARELCARLGIPDAKLVHVMNRVLDDGEASPMDAAAALRIAEVVAIPEGGREVSELMGIGRLEGLLESSNSAASGIAELLERMLPSLGVPFSSPLKRALGNRRKRRW